MAVEKMGTGFEAVDANGVAELEARPRRSVTGYASRPQAWIG
jgi:hypothetical protein